MKFTVIADGGPPVTAVRMIEASVIAAVQPPNIALIDSWSGSA